MAGAWGSGYRGGGNKGGTTSGGSRFAVLSEEPSRQQSQSGFGSGGGRSTSFGQQQQQQGGRGRGAVAAQPTHWRDVVRSDDAGERPPWRLTCYAHERSGDNDLLGDISFEELRWSQVQMSKAGTATGQIVAAEDAAVRAHEANWQALLRASRPPSLGGPPIAAPSSGFAAIAAQPGGLQQAQQPASVFSRLQTAGQGPASAIPPPAPTAGFSNGFSPQSRGFGTAVGGFGGGGFGSSGFGAAAQPRPAVAFGGGAAAQGRMFGGQPQQPGPFQSSAVVMGFGTRPTFGGSGGARPAFGSQQPQLAGSSAAPGPFQVNDAAAHTVVDQPPGAAPGGAVDAWSAAKFTRGSIPEEPPS